MRHAGGGSRVLSLGSYNPRSNKFFLSCWEELVVGAMGYHFKSLGCAMDSRILSLSIKPVRAYILDPNGVAALNMSALQELTVV